MHQPVTLTFTLEDEQAWQLSIMCRRLLADDAMRLTPLSGARRGAHEELTSAVTLLARALETKGYVPG